MIAWDDDIAAMALGDHEKNGLQVFRNYRRAFETHAEKEFSKEVDAEPFDLADLKHVLKLVAAEDARFVPVIACAYADDLLKALFRAEIPDTVPGGKSRLLGPYGPFADLFKRLQLAFVFEILSRDLVSNLDRLRETRNRLSHTWDIQKLDQFFTEDRVQDLFPVVELMDKRPESFLKTQSSPLKNFRVQVVWILARLSYETPLYARAKNLRLSPPNVLYGPNHPNRLRVISKIAMDTSAEIFR